MEHGVRLRVRGRVQGVGYRWFIHRAANKLGVTGYVKNLPDGSVEILAEGQRGELEELIQLAKTGPTWAHVTDIAVEWKPYTGRFKSFGVEF